VFVPAALRIVEVVVGTSVTVIVVVGVVVVAAEWMSVMRGPNAAWFCLDVSPCDFIVSNVLLNVHVLTVVLLVDYGCDLLTLYVPGHFVHVEISHGSFSHDLLLVHQVRIIFVIVDPHGLHAWIHLRNSKRRLVFRRFVVVCSMSVVLHLLHLLHLLCRSQTAVLLWLATIQKKSTPTEILVLKGRDCGSIQSSPNPNQRSDHDIIVVW